MELIFGKAFCGCGNRLRERCYTVDIVVMATARTLHYNDWPWQL